MRFLRQLSLYALLVASALGLAACDSTGGVAHGPLLQVHIASTATSLTAPGTTPLTIYGTYADGSTAVLGSGTLTFKSDSPAVATVSASGVVTAVGGGTANITVTDNATGRIDSLKFTVAATVASILPGPAIIALAVGGTQQITVIGTLTNGQTAGDVTAGSTFQADPSGNVTVSATGLVTAIKVGPASILVTYTATGKTNTVSVNVAPTYLVVDFNASTHPALTPFGTGAESAAIVASSTAPAGGPATGNILKFVKPAGDTACYAGVTIATGGSYLSSVGRLPFSATATTVTVLVYVPVAGVDLKLKVEDATNASVSVETDVVAAAAGWQTVTFHFSKQAPGTSALDLTKTYDKITFFGDFTCTSGNGVPAADENFFIAAITFVGASGPSAPPLSAPAYLVVDFNATTAPGLTPFGTGAETAAIVASSTAPAGGPTTGNVMKFLKPAGDTACYAGVTLSAGGSYLNSIGRIPFSATAKTVTLLLYVPVAGVDLKLKVEDATNAGVSVETDVVAAAAGWQTVTFDFSKQAPGTSALDLTKTYDKITFFGDFTCTSGNGVPAADENFYLAAVTFVGATGPSAPPLRPPPALVSIALTPNPVAVSQNATQQLQAKGTYSDASTADITATVRYASDNNTNATVSNTGLVTGLVVGSPAANITAGLSGVTSPKDPVNVSAVAVQQYTVLDFNTALPAPQVYLLTPFGSGAETASITSAGVPPAGPANNVAKFTKPKADAACYAGMTMSVGSSLSIGRVPFSATATTMTLVVYAPVAGVDVKLKLEDATDNTHTVETDVMVPTTGWQTLTFDFSKQATGTAALNLAFMYDKISFFGDFTCANGGPVPANDETFYLGPITFIGASGPSAPPLGGAKTLVSIALTPNPVAVALNGTQQLTATGTYSDASTANITATVVYASDNNTNATVSNAGLVTGLVNGSPTANITASLSGVTSPKDPVNVGAAVSQYTVLDFNTALTPPQAYLLTPFGSGAEMTAITSAGVPAGGPANNVAKFVKPTGDAACYAGMSMSVGNSLSIARLPFSATATVLTALVYVPVAGKDIKLKAENATDPTKTVETDVVPAATGWQTLSFDMSHQAPGTAALDPAQTFNKLSFFGDFTCANGGPVPAANEAFFIGPIKFIGASGPSGPPL